MKKQTKGLTRDTIDKYYTKEVVVEQSLDLVKRHLKLNRDDLIIEPSAGNGSFIEGIKSLTNNSFLCFEHFVTVFISS